MITRMLVLAMVLTITLVVTTPALAATPIPGYPSFEITDNGELFEGGDIGWGKCSTLLQQRRDNLTPNKPYYESEIRVIKACEKAEHIGLLADTGGPQIILVPIALLVAGGLLIRKYTAL
jgi:hypothetical protein